MTTHMLQCDPADLLSTYVELLFRSELFGPKSYRRYPDFEFFVARMRFLLATVTDEHISDLFRFTEVDVAREPRATAIGRSAAVTAALLAALLKDRRYTDRFAQMVAGTGDNGNTDGNVNIDAAWYACAVLLDSPHIPSLLLEARDRAFAAPGEGAPSGRPGMSLTRRGLVQAALERIDARSSTNFADQCTPDIPPDEVENAQRRLTKFLDTAEILRCGFDCATPAELQSQIKRFIATATPIELQIAGALAPPRIRAYQPWRGANPHCQSALAQFKARYAVFPSIGRTIPVPFVREFAQAQGLDGAVEPPPPRRDHFLLRHVNEWLNATAPDEFWLRVGVRGATEAFDIVASLELDLHHRMPADIVDTLYEKLATLVSFDAGSYRQHAYDLLMRSSANDAKAKRLIDTAATIEADQVSLSRFRLVRMPKSYSGNETYPI